MKQGPNEGTLCLWRLRHNTANYRHHGRARIAVAQVVEQPRPVCAGHSAVVDAPAAFAVRIVVETGQRNPRASLEACPIGANALPSGPARRFTTGAGPPLR
jgi:hypothetical protein